MALVGDALQLQLAATHASPAQVLDADMVIQTSGMTTDVRRTPHPLMRQLLTNGHITSDPLGLGVLASADGRLARGTNVWPNLFAIGSLLRGTLWECIAIPEIRLQARNLADHLLAP